MRRPATKPVMSAEEFSRADFPAHFEPNLSGLEAGSSDRQALVRLFSATYDELRRLASSVRRRDPHATLSPTDLVHEAWLKLEDAAGLGVTSKLHFKRIAARAMRQVLIEAARRRLAQKRGGDAAFFITQVDAVAAPVTPEHVLRLNAALMELERVDERQALLVEGRFFGGLDLSETAQLLGVSEATVQRDWRAAKAWLAAELR